jgi:hypothetical protein
VILSYVLYCSSLQYLMCLLLCCMIVRSCCVACLFFLHHLQSTFTTLYILLLKSLERKKTPSSLIPPLPWVCLPPRATLSIHWKKTFCTVRSGHPRICLPHPCISPHRRPSHSIPAACSSVLTIELGVCSVVAAAANLLPRTPRSRISRPWKPPRATVDMMPAPAVFIFSE